MKITNKGLEFQVTETRWAAWWERIYPVWEPYLWPIFAKHLTKDTNLLDVGAWIGPTALYGAQLCKTCYAIEPDPVASSELRSNIELSQIKNIELFDCALSDADGKRHMGNNDFGNSVTRFNCPDQSFEVDCYTISSFVQKHHIKDISLVKMDIEGGEEFVLKDLEFFSQKIPMHLSIHHQFFVDGAAAIETIRKVCGMYDGMYDDNFNRVGMDYLVSHDFTGLRSVYLA